MKDKLIYIMQVFIEKITKKTCNTCKHCVHGCLCDNFDRYAKCSSSIYPHGYEPK